MSDLSIRRLTLAEQAERAAQAFMETGERQPNPYRGTDQDQAWRSIYERQIFELSAAQDTEASA